MKEKEKPKIWEKYQEEEKKRESFYFLFPFVLFF